MMSASKGALTQSSFASDAHVDEVMEDEHGVHRPSLGMKTLQRRQSDIYEDPEWVPGWTELYRPKELTPSTFFPPLAWVPSYVRYAMGRPTEQDKERAGSVLPFSLKGDMVAGLTVGFMLVPQSLAFALLAGLPVEAGLRSSFYPLVFYACFGTIRQVQTGPTALMSLLTGQTLDQLGFSSPDERVLGASVIAFAVGVVSMALGLLRFGFVVDFMSHPVMSAFCAAAGVTIATSQLKHMLALSMPRYKYWWETVAHIFTHLDECQPFTVLLGFSLLIMLLSLKKWKGAGDQKKREKHWMWRFWPRNKAGKPFKVLKFIADLSSVLCVVIGLCIGRVYAAVNVDVKILGDLSGGAPTLAWPFVEGSPSVLDVLVSAFVMAAVGFLETVAVGGKFAAAARYDFDADQELIALGLSNLSSAFAAGYPGTGSFSRTAVNAQFGASSLVACFMTAMVVLVSLFVLMDVIKYLPLCALAPIIIQGALGVIDFHEFKVAFGVSRPEFWVMVATFVISLAMSVKEGLAIGFVLSVVKLLHELGNPNIALLGQRADGSLRDVRNFLDAEPLSDAVAVRMDARLNFTNARKLKEFMAKAVANQEKHEGAVHYVILDAKSINEVDLSGIEILESITELLDKTGQKFMITNLKGPVAARLLKSHLPEAMRKHGGILCADLSQCEAIMEGRDQKGEAAWESVESLARHVEKARKVQGHLTNSACTTPSHCGERTIKERNGTKDVLETSSSSGGGLGADQSKSSLSVGSLGDAGDVASKTDVPLKDDQILNVHDGDDCPMTPKSNVSAGSVRL